MAKRKKPSGRVVRTNRKVPKVGRLKIDIPADVTVEREKSRLVAILFFDFANQTDTRKLNLNGVFDRLFVDLKEKKTVPFGVLVRTAKTLDFPVQVAILAPNGTIAGGFVFSVKSEEIGNQKPDMIQFVGNVQFIAPVEGDYWFDVSFKGKSIGGCPLKIEFRDLKELINGHTRGDA